MSLLKNNCYFLIVNMKNVILLLRSEKLKKYLKIRLNLTYSSIKTIVSWKTSCSVQESTLSSSELIGQHFKNSHHGLFFL